MLAALAADHVRALGSPPAGAARQFARRPAPQPAGEAIDHRPGPAAVHEPAGAPNLCAAADMPLEQTDPWQANDDPALPNRAPRRLLKPATAALLVQILLVAASAVASALLTIFLIQWL